MDHVRIASQIEYTRAALFHLVDKCNKSSVNFECEVPFFVQSFQIITRWKHIQGNAPTNLCY
uniref:Uncharacterized protein n=1 Tax=Manihot esculenta TaxID=3983 RepID=A0A2C9WQ66_MANES